MKGSTVEDWSATARTTDVTGREWELAVKGQVELPSTSHSAELRERVPQGFNPSILLLDLIITPHGDEAQVPTCREIEFIKRPIEPGQFQRVTVLAGNDEVADMEVKRVESLSG